jgi:hypothetical protein
MMKFAIGFDTFAGLQIRKNKKPLPAHSERVRSSAVPTLAMSVRHAADGEEAVTLVGSVK